MWFWWFLFGCNLLFPLAMILGGLVMWKNCHNGINALVGFRSKLSMANMDTWVFANEDCGKRWLKVGLIMLIPSIVAQIPFYRSNNDVVGRVSIIIIVIEGVIMLLSILPTTKKLKAMFNEDGTRKIDDRE